MDVHVRTIWEPQLTDLDALPFALSNRFGFCLDLRCDFLKLLGLNKWNFTCFTPFFLSSPFAVFFMRFELSKQTEAAQEICSKCFIHCIQWHFQLGNVAVMQRFRILTDEKYEDLLQKTSKKKNPTWFYFQKALSGLFISSHQQMSVYIL